MLVGFGGSGLRGFRFRALGFRLVGCEAFGLVLGLIIYFINLG